MRESEWVHFYLLKIWWYLSFTDPNFRDNIFKIPIVLPAMNFLLFLDVFLICRRLSVEDFIFGHLFLPYCNSMQLDYLALIKDLKELKSSTNNYITLQPRYNTLRYNMTLPITRLRLGSQNFVQVLHCLTHWTLEIRLCYSFVTLWFHFKLNINNDLHCWTLIISFISLKVVWRTFSRHRSCLLGSQTL